MGRHHPNGSRPPHCAASERPARTPAPTCSHPCRGRRAQSTLGWSPRRLAEASPEGAAVSTFLWILLACLYFVVLFTLGLTTLRKGHGFLFFFGIFVPFLWLIGAMIGP